MTLLIKFGCCLKAQTKSQSLHWCSNEFCPPTPLSTFQASFIFQKVHAEQKSHREQLKLLADEGQSPSVQCCFGNGFPPQPLPGHAQGQTMLQF